MVGGHPHAGATPVFSGPLGLLWRETLGELAGQALGHPPGVHEHQGRLVLEHVGGDRVEDLAHLLGGDHRLELARRELDRQVELTLVALVHHHAARRSVRKGPSRPAASKESGDRLDRTLGGREADAGRALVAERLEPLEGEGQVRAPLVPRDRVDLVDDHRPDAPQHVATSLGGDQQVERLGRGDEQVRRTLEHRRAILARGVPAAKRDPERGGPAVPSRARPRGSPPAAAGGSAGRLRPGPSAARRTPPGRPRARARPLAPAATLRPRTSRTACRRDARSLRGRSGRCSRGTRKASCPSPWARR